MQRKGVTPEYPQREARRRSTDRIDVSETW